MFTQSDGLVRIGIDRLRVLIAMTATVAGSLGPTGASAQTAKAAAPPTAEARAVSARDLLDRYVLEATRDNLALAGTRAAERRSVAAKREAHGRLLPSLGMNARYSEYSGTVNIGDFINPAYSALNGLLGQPRFPTDIDATLPQRQETKVELVQPLFVPALRAASAAAAVQRDVAGYATGAAVRRLAADVQQAWLAYATGQRVVETLESARTVLDEGLRVSERLVNAGQATPDVVLRARSERSDVLQQIAEAERQRDAARRAFNDLRNRDGDAPIELADDSTLTTGTLLSREALEAHAITHREELQQAAGYVRLAGAQRRIADGAFLPTVALSASYGVQGERYRFDRQHDVALASLVFSWNLFNGGQDAARREQADFAHDEASARGADAERMVRADVRNAYDALRVARVATDAARDRLASAQRAFALIERRWANGLATQVEFLSARAAFTAAALNDVITRYGLAARAVDLERAAATRAITQ